MATQQLQLRGMSCAACAGAVERSIKNVPGVQSCSVNFAAEQATVEFNERSTSVEKIQQAVSDAGYGADLVDETAQMGEQGDADQEQRRQHQQQLTRKVALGAVVSIILVIGHLPMMLACTCRGFPLFCITPGCSWC